MERWEDGKIRPESISTTADIAPQCTSRLLVSDAHRHILHNGVKEMLTEFRSTYWLVRGWHYVRMLIHRCVICHQFEGMLYKSVSSPALPDFHVTQSRPFQNSGVNFAGPMYIKGAENSKGWLCLYTYCTTKAVHLEIVPDLNASTFLCCFRRFTSRHGVLNKMVSDNAKTFKAGLEALKKITSY